MYFVDQACVVEGPVNRLASFDEQVRHAEAAQFRHRRRQIGAAVASGRDSEHFRIE